MDGPPHGPLGVLKAGTIDFVPPLPGEKLAAIQAMGYNTVNKCILSWYDGSALMWPEEAMWFMLIMPEEEMPDTWIKHSSTHCCLWGGGRLFPL